MTRVVLTGRAGSPGIGLGRLLIVVPAVNGHGPASRGSPGRAAASAGPPGGPAAERERLVTALETAASDLEALARQVAQRAGEEIGAIFEAQALFARDPGIIDPALEAIASGSAADVAILDSTDEQAGSPGRRRRRVFPGASSGRPRCRSARGGAPARIDRDGPVAPRRAAGGHRRGGSRPIGGGDPAAGARRRDRPGRRRPDRSCRRSSREGSGSRSCWVSGPATTALPAAADGLVDGGLGRLIVEPDAEDIAVAESRPRRATSRLRPRRFGRRRPGGGQRERRLRPRGGGRGTGGS